MIFEVSEQVLAARPQLPQLAPRPRYGNPQSDSPPRLVTGEPTAEKVGRSVLADGGNAIDAVVAAVPGRAPKQALSRCAGRDFYIFVPRLAQNDQLQRVMRWRSGSSLTGFHPLSADLAHQSCPGIRL